MVALREISPWARKAGTLDLASFPMSSMHSPCFVARASRASYSQQMAEAPTHSFVQNSSGSLIVHLPYTLAHKLVDTTRWIK